MQPQLVVWLVGWLDYVVMYAENEASKGQVVVKNMRNSEQNAIDEESLVAYIKDQGQK